MRRPRAEVENLPHFVYRCYNKDGDLLYVGASCDVSKRMAQHKYQSLWSSVVSHISSIQFRNKRAARHAETAAIIRERPLFNVACNHAARRRAAGHPREGIMSLPAAAFYMGFPTGSFLKFAAKHEIPLTWDGSSATCDKRDLDRFADSLSTEKKAVNQ